MKNVARILRTGALVTILVVGSVSATTRSANAFADEIYDQLRGIILFAFTNVKCENEILDRDGHGSTPIRISQDAPVCDPFFLTSTETKGLDSDTQLWEGVLPLALTDQLTVGVVLGKGSNNSKWKEVYEHDFDNDFTTFGAFAAFEPVPDTRIVGAVTFTDMDTDFTAFYAPTATSGSFGTDIVGFQLRGETLYRMNGYWVRPTVTLNHFRAETESFVDSAFNEFSAGFDMKATSISAGGEIGIPLLMKENCGEVGMPACAPKLTLLANANIFYHTSSEDGVIGDPAFPVPDVDESYFGGGIGAGFAWHVNENVELGGRASAFAGGDTDGYQIQAFANINLWGLLGKSRPRPLFERGY